MANVLLIRLRNRWVDSGRKEGGKGESTGEEAITSREKDSRATHLLIQIQFVHSAHPLLPIFTFSPSAKAGGGVPAHLALVWRRIQILWWCSREHIPRSLVIWRSVPSSTHSQCQPTLLVGSPDERCHWRTVPGPSGTLPSSNISLA